jgi:hypothetical protein
MRPTAYRRNARGLRDRQAFEHVRMQAGALRAVERDERAIARWVAEDWPSHPGQRPSPPGRHRVLG